MSEPTADADFVEAGRKLFAGEAEFFFAAAKPTGLPEIGAPEIAFGGRSNVGKSSLINALTGRNGLARTVRVECAAGLRGVRRCRHDLIFANILARPIARMARDFSRKRRPETIPNSTVSPPAGRSERARRRIPAA